MFYSFSFPFCATQATYDNDLVSSKVCILLCSTWGKGETAKFIRKKSAGVDYSQRLPSYDFLVFFFSRKENKEEIVFENLLEKKKKAMLPSSHSMVKTARIWQF